MTDHSNVPVVTTGDWIDAAWINQYIGDNFRAIYQAYQAAGDMAYAIDADTIGRLTITNGGVLIGGASAPSWLAVPAGLGFLKHNGTAPSWFTGGSAYQLLRKNSGNSDFEWADLANLLQAVAMISGQSAEDLFVGASGTTIKRLAKGSNRDMLRVSGSGVLEYAPIGAWCTAKRSTDLTGVSAADNTPVTWNAYDGENWYSTTKITAPAAGDYRLSGAVLMSAASVYRNYEVKLRINGSNYISVAKNWSSDSYDFGATLAGRIVTLAAGDYVELTVSNCNGTVRAEGSWMQAERVR